MAFIIQHISYVIAIPRVALEKLKQGIVTRQARLEVILPTLPGELLLGGAALYQISTTYWSHAIQLMLSGSVRN